MRLLPRTDGAATDGAPSATDGQVRAAALMEVHWGQLRQAFAREAAAVAEQAVLGEHLARAMREVAQLKAQLERAEKRAGEAA